MRKTHLILFIAVLLVLQILTLSNTAQTNHLVDLFAVLMIGVAGIPHGAIDHVINKEIVNQSRVKFYGIYLGLFAFVLLFWFFFSTIAFILFLALSAHHFGDTHYSDAKIGGRFMFSLVKNSWGFTVILALFYFSFNRLDFSFIGAPEIDQLLNDIGENNLLGALLVCGGLHVVLMIYSWVNMEINGDKFKGELFLFTVIMLLFVILPPLTAFALFFLCIHASESIEMEYFYLLKKGRVKNRRQFALLLVPFTAISLIGIALIYVFTLYSDLHIELFHFSFATIAALTLPHSIIMATLVKQTIKLHGSGS